MFGCSFVQAPSIYYMSSTGDILRGYLGKSIHVPPSYYVVLRI